MYPETGAPYACANCLVSINDGSRQSYRCENCERDFCSNCISPFGQCEECENEDLMETI